MICPRCKTTMKDNYCMKCGYLVQNNQAYQIKYDFEDKNLLADFLGTKYSYFIERKFNISSGLLGPIYLGYRKCFKEAICGTLLDTVVGFSYFYIVNHFVLFSSTLDSMRIFSNTFLFLILVMRFLLYGTLFNYYYVEKIKKKMEVKNDCNSEHSSNTSVLQAIIIGLLQPLILVIIWASYMWLQ